MDVLWARGSMELTTSSSSILQEIEMLGDNGVTGLPGSSSAA